ncbi:MAG: response regulator [Betaproteobacteria bacterium]
MNEGIEAKGLRALVVDDDDTMVEYVSRVLKGAGYRVESCGDGMAALEQFRAAPFDVVIVDLRMPRLSGLSFLKNLRLPAGSPHRVVLLSSTDDPKVQREVLDAGAAAYLVKPASAKDILDAAGGFVKTG